MNQQHDSSAQSSFPPGTIFHKRFLLLCPSEPHYRDLLDTLERHEDVSVTSDDPPALVYQQLHAELVPAYRACDALELLHHTYFNLIVLDLRGTVGQGTVTEHLQEAHCLLDSMANAQDVETRFGFHRVLALVSGPDNAELDDAMIALGQRGVGRVIRDASGCKLSSRCPKGVRREEFAQRTADAMQSMTVKQAHGKRALAASGGGITGMYFEMGALKCLEDAMVGGSLNDFDMYFGISAGSVITSFLVHGYTISEFMGAIAGYEHGRIPPVSLSLFRLKHANVSGYIQRTKRIIGGLGHGARELLHGNVQATVEDMLIRYSDFLAPPFHGDGFERLLADLFTRFGNHNDFRKLKQPLFVGATDQDARTHVVFGEEGFDDIPISKAVQASMALNPAFRSAEIRGRYYEDGAVTRTSNFIEAIRKGADLIFVVDPLVPYVSKYPGWARKRGMLFNVDQDIRTISYTRYENARNLMLRHHPQVSSYTFLPANSLRELMSINPMDHRPYAKIWQGAYLSTLHRMKMLAYRMDGDLRVHGVTMDLSKPEAIAARLETTSSPAFEDFFLDRRVEI